MSMDLAIDQASGNSMSSGSGMMCSETQAADDPMADKPKASGMPLLPEHGDDARRHWWDAAQHAGHGNAKAIVDLSFSRDCVSCCAILPENLG